MNLGVRMGNFGRLLFLFSGVTFFILAIVGNFGLSRYREFSRSKLAEQMQKMLDVAVSSSIRGNFVRKRLDEFINMVRRFGAKSPKIEKLLRTFESDWGLTLKAYVYKEFKPVKVFPDGAPHVELMRDILKGCKLSGKELSEEQRRLHRSILTVFGEGNRLDLIKQWEGSLNGISSSSPGLFFNTNTQDGYNFFFLVASWPQATFLFERLPLAIREKTGFRPHEGERKWITPPGISPDQIEAAWKRFKEESTPILFWNNQAWIFCQNPLEDIWCCVSEENPSTVGKGVEIGVFLGYFISGVLMLLFILGFWNLDWVKNLESRLNVLPISIKINALFFMASILPLIMAIIIGAIAMMDREELQAEKARQESDRLFLDLANSYYTCIEEFKQLSAKLRNSEIVLKGMTEAIEEEVFARISEDKLQRVEIRNGDNEVIFTTFDPAVHGSSWMTETFSKIALRRHAPQRVGERLQKISGQDIVTESLFSNIDPTIMTPMKLPGKVWLIRMDGGSPPLWFWDVYPEISSGPAFIFITNQLGWAYKKKLEEILNAQDFAKGSVLGYIQNLWNETPYRTFPKFPFRFPEEFLAAALRSKETKQAIYRELSLQGQKYWVMFKPDVFLTNEVFFHLLPVSSQLSLLMPIRRRLAMTALAAVFVAALAAWLLARLFIVPIRDISKGITAIQQRDDKARIPLRRNDEFELVVTAFNRILAGLKELQYGRIIQESLLPANPIAPEGYELACFRTPATELAGDYHDFFTLPDGRFIMIQGDVTGHGVSAALAMAMAKATIDYQKIAGWDFPSEIMEKLNALFNKELKPRRKLMTFLCLVLDPNSHQITFQNAGHLYPLHFEKATGKAKEIVSGSFPLGTRKQMVSNPIAFSIATGDHILLYTDGFTECMDSKFQQFGFKRLSTFFETFIQEGFETKKILYELMLELDSFRLPGPYPDDITLMLLKRKDNP